MRGEIRGFSRPFQRFVPRYSFQAYCFSVKNLTLIYPMRLLNRYILKELFLPFVFSLLIIVFILFTNFLLRAIDRFLGKGLDPGTIVEYLFLNLAWIVALAVPMAVLIATLMTFGRLSEDNEINAMRSSGISFLTIIRPALIFGLLVGIVLAYFNNYVLPEMNFRARILSGDIYRKRPGLSIEPGHFIDDLPDYSMIIQDKDGDTLRDVRIFSKGVQKTQTTITAEKGTLSTIKDAIILTLYDGEIHELNQVDYEEYRRIQFRKHVITLPAENLVLVRRDTSNRRDREMTVPMMRAKLRTYRQRLETVRQRIARSLQKSLGDSLVPPTARAAQELITAARQATDRDSTLSDNQKRKRQRHLKTLSRRIANEYNLIASYSKSYNRYDVEIHKKFSLPFACLVFVLVGTPLGVLAKKGGFVVGTSLSFGFFMIYYIFLIGGEEMADRNLVSPAVGMWTPNVLLLIVGGYLTLHTVRERTPFRIPWPQWTFFKRKTVDA
ncbi:MAG: YjgP/YjgQ family permease [Candidatus Neomarinimicrobiota bacterium]|nr:MAG: YjgP/YjgQ family permease [Candidatus Neomarinimicrobiota bacterium]